MNDAYVVVTLALIAVFTAAMVVAAFLDRRRGREIEHDLAPTRHRKHEEG